MIGWGIFLFIIGLVTIGDGNSSAGVIILIIGIILFIVGLAKGGTNPNTGDSVNELKNKINLIEEFYQILLDSDIGKDQKDEYKNIINFFEQLKLSTINLNYEGVNLINEEYFRINKIYSDLLEKLNKKYAKLEDCYFSFDYDMLQRGIINSEKDLLSLLNTDNLLNYLLLLSNKSTVSRQGYENFNATNIGLPEQPKKIHLYSMICFTTKAIIDGNNNILFSSLKNLINDVVDDSELRKLLRKLYKEKLYELKKMYEKEEDDDVLAIILFLNPEFGEQYNKNNKFYKKLGVSKNSTKEEIEKAYKKLLLSSHPDRGGDDQEWAKINEAYIKVRDL